MYRRVLLAYDGSLDGRNALREGALLAMKCNAEIYLLSVLTGSSGINIADSVYTGQASAQQHASFTAILDDGVARLRRLGLQPVARLVSGEPAKEISSFAREIAADLVVVSHRRQNFLSRWWSGSSGAFMLDNVDCSLLVSRRVIDDQEFDAELRKIGVDPGLRQQPA
jgi:nucleotide-binding universal stress UspA family protein